LAPGKRDPAVYLRTLQAIISTFPSLVKQQLVKLLGAILLVPLWWWKVAGGIVFVVVFVAVPSNIKVSISIHTLMLDVTATPTHIPTTTKALGGSTAPFSVGTSSQLQRCHVGR
jgi:hypothetical protein